MQNQITIKNAHLHNLKNITLSIPKNQVVVFTGLSGSGKSTLVLDTLHQEGQRQYMESLGLVTHGMTQPEVDRIEGLSPSISVDQHLTNHSPRSTVGTATEVFTYLRVLFARIGHRPCPQCGADIPPAYDVNTAAEDTDEPDGPETVDFVNTYPCPHCGTPVPEMGMAHFSFNKPAGACPTCTGLGVIHRPQLNKLIDPEKSIAAGAVYGWDAFYTKHNTETLRAAGRHYGFTFDPQLPVQAYPPAQHDLLLYGVDSPQFRRHFPETEPPTTVSRGRFEGIVTNLLRRYAEHILDADYREKTETLLTTAVCPDCAGTRLRPESRQVHVAGQTLVEICRQPLSQLAEWLDQLPERVSAEERLITEPILIDLHERVRRLVDVGAGYLTLERASPTLSAGEAQRLRLAALLGSGLTGVLYVLDEPTIGLHPRDYPRLVRVMRQLRDLGNTVLVIEHDLEILRAADYLVDIGPGGGRHGGEVVAVGSPAEVSANLASVTGAYLSGRTQMPIPARRASRGESLVIHGARAHNLQNLTVTFPLGLFIAVTGVSGSGKSSLMFDILDRAARQRFYNAGEPPGEHDRITGWEHFDKVITIDQAAIGRSPRSNAATYTDAFSAIRAVFAAQPAAQAQKLTARHFSFNVPGGRCERCEGAGQLFAKMHFLPDVPVRCPACHGHRFKRDVLAVTYARHTVAQVLDLTIEDALNLFQAEPAVAAKLALMTEVGLGYLQLGQPATTLSGGEAQRVKLAKELSRRAAGRTLYLLDEPTTGLHPADTARLIHLLHRLVDAGHTVIVIEHNVEVMKAADWLIDLGPEGGAAGGRQVAEGTPEQVAQNAASHTGQCLQRAL